MTQVNRTPNVISIVAVTDLNTCTPFSYQDVSGASIINPTGNPKVLTVLHCETEDGTFRPHNDETGTPVVINAQANTSQQFPHAALFGCHFLKFQAADADTTRLIVTVKG